MIWPSGNCRSSPSSWKWRKDLRTPCNAKASGETDCVHGFLLVSDATCLEQSRGKLFVGEVQHHRDLRGGLQVLVEFLLLERIPQLDVLGYKRAPPLPRLDHAFVLEFQVGALDGDDADLDGRGQCADGGNLLPGLELTHGDPVADLLLDLQVQRPGVGLRDHQWTVYVCMHGIHSMHRRKCGVNARPGTRPGNRDLERA